MFAIHDIFGRPGVRAAALLLAAACAGCRTNARQREATAQSLASDGRTPLHFPPPPDSSGLAETWTRQARAGGTEYVLTKPSGDDVVRMFGFREPAASGVRSLEDLERRLSAGGGSGRFVRLERGEAGGKPVLRFETLEAGSAADPMHLPSLPGDAAVPPSVRTRGAFLFRPAAGSSAAEVVTLAVSRASRHGEIGTYYESLFDTWLASIAAGQAP